MAFSESRWWPSSLETLETQTEHSLMPRFVVLYHEMAIEDQRPSHWDFMLEWNETLRTWALEDEPGSKAEIRSESLPDHRLMYLDYEGPVSQNRGEVRRWDAGTFELFRENDNELVVLLDGKKLQGAMTLRRMKDEPQRWIVAFDSPGSPPTC